MSFSLLHSLYFQSHVFADRKSTRLNSSHRCISYAVFCLKKKKQHRVSSTPTPLQPHYSTSTHCDATPPNHGYSTNLNRHCACCSRSPIPPSLLCDLYPRT